MPSLKTCVGECVSSDKERDEVLGRLTANRDGHLEDKVDPQTARRAAVDDVFRELQQEHDHIMRQVEASLGKRGNGAAQEVSQERAAGETQTQERPTGETQKQQGPVNPEINKRTEDINPNVNNQAIPEKKPEQGSMNREPAPAAKIEDFGEKIGGARKDLAESPGTKTKQPKEKDESAPWEKRFKAVENSVHPGEWTILDTKSKSPWGGLSRQKFSSEKEAKEAVPIYAVAQNHIVRAVEDGKFAIFKKVGERKVFKVVNKTFDSREEGMKYMAAHAKDILGMKTTFGEEILPVPEIAKREGVAHRDKDATPEMFMKTFAPRGIEFGNWNNQEERQLILNHAYDGLSDLADVLKISPKALMLNGDLGIAFGARGQGLSGAKAHYERDYGTINLTKMKGAGSLAHEWFHALDHYLARQDTKASSEKVDDGRGNLIYKTKSSLYDMQSHGPSTRSKIRPEVREAYETLMKTMFKKAENYVEDTKVAEKFVGRSREHLGEILNSIRTELSRDLTSQAKKNGGYRRSEKGLFPASAEQLSEFDRLSDVLKEGGSLKTSFIPSEEKTKGRFFRSTAGRMSNDVLDSMDKIIKDVRGRSGFRKEGGDLDRVRAAMDTYAQRLKMFDDAQSSTKKTKQVPTNYAIEAKKMDQARTGDYWSEPHEMAARAFASYVEDKIADQGHQSDFMVYRAHGGILLPMIDGFIARPYPEGKERIAIDKAFDSFVSTLKSKETDKGTALYSKTPNQLVGGKVEDIPKDFSDLNLRQRAIVRPLVRGGKLQAIKAGDIEGILHEAGGAVKDVNAKYSADGKIQGFALPDGRAFIVPENISKGEMWPVVRHEVGVHVGKALHDDAGFQKLLDSIESRKDEQSATGEAIRSAFDMVPKGTNPDHINEEALAYLVQHAPETGIARQVIALVKKALVKLGIADPKILNEKDLSALADLAIRRQAWNAGKEESQQTAETMFSKQDQTKTPEFKDWFGKSKITKDGEPVVLYHGTSDPRFLQDPDYNWTFDQGRQHRQDSSPLAGLGIFLGNKTIADAHSSGTEGTTHGFYVRMEHPRYIDSDQLAKKVTDFDSARAYRKQLEEVGGYDGLVIKDRGQAIAFHPDQLKSATDNTGAFSRDNSDVRFSKGGIEDEKQKTEGQTEAPTKDDGIRDMRDVLHRNGERGDINSETGPRDSLGNPERGNSSSGVRYSISPADQEETHFNPDEMPGGKNWKMEDTGNVLKNFYHQDIDSTVKGFKDSVKEMYKGVIRAVNPMMASKDALMSGRAIIQQLGETSHYTELQAQRLDRVAEKYSDSTSKFGKFLDRMQTSTGRLADKIFNNMSDKENIDFIARIQHGQKQDTPVLQEIADSLKSMWEDMRDKVRALDTGALNKFRENYFPQMWKGKGKTEEVMRAILAKRPLEGSKNFTKERLYDDVLEGLSHNEELVSTNPLDLAFMKLREMQQYLNAHTALQEMEKNGLAALVPVGGKMPKGFEGHVLISEPFGVVTRKNGESLRYVATPDVAQVINNYVSKSLYDSPFLGEGFKRYMGVASALNTFQLGVGSMFHAGFTTMESMISHTALGVKALSEGKVLEAAKLFATAPTAPYAMLKKGMQVMDAYMGKTDNPEMSNIVRWLELAGARKGMDTRFNLGSTQSMLQSWKNGNKIGAAIRSPLAFIEQTARPTMEWLVPRQKFAAFSEMAHYWTESHPDATHEELRSAMQQIWNRVDSRMGQVVYDRMFINNATKNIAQALFRAPGWTGGTMVEVGGGLLDTAKGIAGLAKGKMPVMTDKMAYTAAMLATTMIANGILTAAFTGQMPQDKDWMGFRTGKLDEKGNPERFLLPTYVKDLNSWMSHPGQTLSNKLHPLIGLLHEIAKNKDYYGTEIRNPKDNFIQQAGEVLGYGVKAFTPFWMRGASKAYNRGDSALSMALPLVGVMPAPAAENMSKAQQAMSDINHQRMNDMARTKDEYDRAQLKQQLLQGLRQNSPGINDQDALQVYNVATPEEQAKIKPLMLKKRYDALRNNQQVEE